MSAKFNIVPLSQSQCLFHIVHLDPPPGCKSIVHESDLWSLCMLNAIRRTVFRGQKSNDFSEMYFRKEFRKSALLVLWSGFRNLPLQSLVTQCFSRTFWTALFEREPWKVKPPLSRYFFSFLWAHMSSSHMARILALLQHTWKMKEILKIPSVLKIFSKPRPQKNSLATGVILRWADLQPCTKFMLHNTPIENGSLYNIKNKNVRHLYKKSPKIEFVVFSHVVKDFCAFLPV